MATNSTIIKRIMGGRGCRASDLEERDRRSVAEDGQKLVLRFHEFADDDEDTVEIRADCENAPPFWLGFHVSKRGLERIGLDPLAPKVEPGCNVMLSDGEKTVGARGFESSFDSTTGVVEITDASAPSFRMRVRFPRAALEKI
jgi:hypothetical protein